MADFEAPSFSLGLDSDSEPQHNFVSPQTDPSSSNQFPVTQNDDFETLIVDDSEPEYPDPCPKLKRLRRGITNDATASSSTTVELGLSNQRKVNESIDLLSTAENPLEDLKSEKSCLGFDHSLPPAHRYFFHSDIRIQELVRIRLPYYSPLSITSNIGLDLDLNQPSTSKIDYMGQFNSGGSSKEAARNNKDKKSSNSIKNSRKSEIEDMSDGWVNPKLAVDKRIMKRTAKRKGNSVQKTTGHWLTSPNGKKVYIGKKGQELTGRGAYIQYKKESGIGFKKAKRKSASTNKKKKNK